MKLINSLIGLIAIVLVIGFVFVWMFEPEKKQNMLDWWHGMTLDCAQVQNEVINDQTCRLSDDCVLSRRESIRAEKLAAQYSRYCGSL